MRRKQALTATLLVATLALSACSDKTPGVGTPVPSGSAPSSPQQSSPGTSANNAAKAPPVTKPLNGSKFIEDPCLSLTQTQLAAFETTDPGKRNDGAAKACDWKLGTSGDVVAEVSYNPSLTAGLSHLYAQNAAGFYSQGYFEATQLDGYPAVRLDAIDARADGDCALSVGISEQLFFTVRINGKTGTNGCKAAENVAKAALTTIREG
ncbi:DUF3558 family protein [Amycolatopsis sp. NPDC059657]|uniref:DUF3558 family protein n=1 Tax=Amycolatopsis sp. NPDC059657 TaxID=3346899 RepID=UPI0036705F33